MEEQLVEHRSCKAFHLCTCSSVSWALYLKTSVSLISQQRRNTVEESRRRGWRWREIALLSRQLLFVFAQKYHQVGCILQPGGAHSEISPCPPKFLTAHNSQFTMVHRNHLTEAAAKPCVILWDFFSFLNRHMLP